MGMSIAGVPGQVRGSAEVIVSASKSTLHQVKQIGAGIGRLITWIRQAADKPMAERSSSRLNSTAWTDYSSRFPGGKILLEIRQQLKETASEMEDAVDRQVQCNVRWHDLYQKKTQLEDLEWHVEQHYHDDANSRVIKDGHGRLALAPVGGWRERFGLAQAAQRKGEKIMRECGLIIPGEKTYETLRNAIVARVSELDASMHDCSVETQRYKAAHARAYHDHGKAEIAQAAEKRAAERCQESLDGLHARHSTNTAKLTMLQGLASVLESKLRERILVRGCLTYSPGNGTWRIEEGPEKGAGSRREYTEVPGHLRSFGMDVDDNSLVSPSSDRRVPRYDLKILASNVETCIARVSSDIKACTEEMQDLDRAWSGRTSPLPSRMLPGVNDAARHGTLRSRGSDASESSALEMRVILDKAEWMTSDTYGSDATESVA